MNIWVSAVGAVAALAGAWGGQWIAARRDDRRWERDQHREDLRWERDVQRELRDRTFTAYSAFLAAVRLQQHAITRMQTDIGNRANSADNEESNEESIVASEREVELAYRDLSEKVASLQIVAPPEIYEQAAGFLGEVISLWGTLSKGWGAVSSASSPSDWRDVLDEIKVVKGEMRQERDALAEELRRHMDTLYGTGR